MLTRDISLADAILDLVDNCLDGALRLADGHAVRYEKHYVHISVGEEGFAIDDNCGGIPRATARDYAFKMGREQDDDRDSDSETIGIYGVGMKRAIFKMGREAVVSTRHGGGGYQVRIGADWLDSPAWGPLTIEDTGADTGSEPGTRIQVSALNPGVGRHFASETFLSDLRKAIAEHFTVFLQQGLVIALNDVAVDAVKLEVLVSDDENGPAPYVYQKVIGDVRVSIAVGLNTRNGVPDEEDGGPDVERDRSKPTAGWTVFCNDRAVIVGDRGRLTGWGDGLPLFHYQFSVITGIIEFRSTNADKLPVTTTKRALDTTSDVWLEAYTVMKRALRVWVTYTNRWKTHPRTDLMTQWESARPLSLQEAVEVVSVRASARQADGSVEFNPKKREAISWPATSDPSSRRVTFVRPAGEVRAVSYGLFGTDDEKPGVVGAKCFEMVLNSVREPKD